MYSTFYDTFINARADVAISHYTTMVQYYFLYSLHWALDLSGLFTTLQVCALKHHHFYPPSFSEIHFTLFFADLTFLDATLSDIHQYLSVSD